MREHRGSNLALPRRAESGVFRGRLQGEWTLRQQLHSSRGRFVFQAWNEATCEGGVLEFLDVRHSDPEAQERFVRRRDAMLKLRHPCILRLLDHGDDPLPFLVDERPAHGRLTDSAPLFADDLWRALRIARDVALGLGVAHRAGMVHRDVNPDDIHLHSMEHACVGGFGVVHDVGLSTITKTGERLGSRPFAAPEAYEGDPSPAFDVYCLGAVLHSLLSGERSPSPPYSLRKHYRPLARPAGPPLLAHIDVLLQDMLRLDRHARPQSMEQVIAQLDRLLAIAHAPR